VPGSGEEVEREDGRKDKMVCVQIMKPSSEESYHHYLSNIEIV